MFSLVCPFLPFQGLVAVPKKHPIAVFSLFSFSFSLRLDSPTRGSCLGKFPLKFCTFRFLWPFGHLLLCFYVVLDLCFFFQVSIRSPSSHSFPIYHLMRPLLFPPKNCLLSSCISIPGHSSKSYLRLVFFRPQPFQPCGTYLV